MTFHSEYGEDRWLYEQGLLPARGTYVDIGAAWPVEYSNSALLRDLGWKGIQVDGCAQFKPLWDALGLDLIVAVIWTGPEARYAVNADRPNLSKVTPAGEPVPAVTLPELLARHNIGKIDLLTVDVEGAEFDILTTLDFERHRPSLIIWEYNTLGVKNEKLMPYLSEQRYHCIHQTECNYIHAAF